MKNTTAPKAKGIVIRRLSNAEALAVVRKASVRSGQTFKAGTDFRRKPKHFTGWD